MFVWFITINCYQQIFFTMQEKIKELEQENSRLKNKLKLHDAATLDNFNDQIEGLKALIETKGRYLFKMQ